MWLWGLKMRAQIWGWPTVVRLPSGLARGRRTPEDRGSRPVLAQNQGVRVPIPARAFYAPENTPLGFLVAKNSDTDFSLKPRSCGRQLPAALFYPPKKQAPGFLHS